jgi:outer membrane immunogenic protein
MRVTIRNPFRPMLIMAALLATQAVAHAQQPAAAQKPLRGELALDYTYVRANAPPGGCGCFNMNGGSISFAWPLGSKFAVVGDATFDEAATISKDSLDLVLQTYTGGIRFRPHFRTSPLSPFGQVMVGVAHASGSLVDSSQYTVPNAGAAFAANVGAGIDLRASRRISIRLFEGDYLVTTFQNGDNDHQNNIRVSSGLVLHF